LLSEQCIENGGLKQVLFFMEKYINFSTFKLYTNKRIEMTYNISDKRIYIILK